MAIVALAFLSAPALAQGVSEERILSFVSDIVVAKNGDLTVTETITVQAMGDQIRHGIFRDFPTEYTDRMGNRTRVRFDVVDVKRDGKEEPYTLEDLDNGVRVKIGDKDVILEVGRYTYTISYITNRQIGFFDGFDELYWNVTGNGWAFGIDRAEAKIRLPDGAQIDRHAFYTGPEGAKQQDGIARIGKARARFYTTTPLGPREGLTVAVGFNKGVITPPSKSELRAEYIAENASNVVVSMGVLALLIYYLAAWYQYGRDPRRGTIIPLFSPPNQLSPSTIRYIRNMAYDRKCFAAALIDMAVKGYLRISENDGEYTLTRTEKSETLATLSSGEKKIGKELFGSSKTIVLKQTNHTVINRAIEALKTSLKTDDQKQYFVTNSGWFFGGMAILALVAVTAALLSHSPAAAGFMLVWLSGWTVGTAFLLHQTVSTWAGVFTGGPGSRIMAFFSSVFISLFSLPFLGGLIFGIFMFGYTVTPIVVIALMAGGIMAYVFYYLLKAPTLAGAAVRDQIDGFKMFLATTEKERLEVLHPPNVTPELFEKYLPFAIALDCENQWSRKFDAEMARASAEPQNYQPGWYSGSYRGFSGGFASGIGSSLANAAAASSSAPGSSSGSGGGGSSGGGGGGGGGGGW